MKLSDFVADFLADIGSHVYGVCGAGAMHLNDSICNHPRIKFIATHHEQAAAMAAEAESRVTGKIGLVHVTAGPGGTNTITGVAGAWVDSIPMLVIAGQVGTSVLKKRSGLRQLGTNELGLVEMVGSITKYAVTVTDPQTIRYHLERAVYLATLMRNGPVWVEIPLDVQCAEINPDLLAGMPEQERLNISNGSYLKGAAQRVAEALNAAKRPLVIAGNGIHLAGAESLVREFVDRWGIPVVTSWNASDIFDSGQALYVGRPGIMGDRAGNFAVQNADLILAIGTRLSVPQIGHSAEKFAPRAKLVMVDIDSSEADKPTVRVDYAVVADAKRFLAAMGNVEGIHRHEDETWPSQCREWKYRYPVMLPEYRDTKDGVNSYFFMEELAKHLDEDAIIVTDVGAAFISAMQSLKLNGKQRLFHSGGVSSMGWGIPAAIGACLGSGRKQTICLVGDGGAMMNLQELATIVHHDLPIKIFVFVNGGYLTMQYTQNNHFKREAASSEKSGVSCPNFECVADAFGMDAHAIRRQGEHFDWHLRTVMTSKRIQLCEVHMPPGQLLQPRVQSKMKDGKFVPVPLDDMWPYLPADELAKNMVSA